MPTYNSDKPSLSVAESGTHQVSNWALGTCTERSRSIGHWEWGMGDGALGMGHWALGTVP